MSESKRVGGRLKYYRSSFRALPSRARKASGFRKAASDAPDLVPSPSPSSWRAKFFATFALILMLGLLYEFLSEDLFFVYKLEVQGINYLSQTEVESASRVSGFNIFFIEPGTVERTLRQLPEIKSVHVATGLPNILLVQIEERTPTALWLKGNQTAWVDDEGYAFQMRSQRNDLPIVRDLDLGELKPGKRVQPAAMIAVRAVRDGWADAPRNFEWTAAGGLSTTDVRGWRILFGDATDMDFKIAKLQAMIPTLVAQGARIKLIDLGKGDPYYQ
jgi:cell division protein FtsQ